MAGENVITTAQGLYKRVYGSKLNDLKPKVRTLQERFKFSSREKVGESYREGVILQGPNGFTYSGSSGAVVTLNAAVNMVSKQAEIIPSELILREQISYAAMSRAVQEGDAAFASLTGEVLTAMKEAHHCRVEGSILHGQRGYGTVSAVADGGSSTVDVTFSAETWAPGIWWNFGKGSKWDAFTSTTKNNGDGVLTVSKITSSTRTIRFTHSGTFSDQVAVGDVFYPQGAYDGTTHTDFLGLMKQGENTGSMFGIDAATEPNWQGNTRSAGGALTFAFVEECLSELRDRGAGDGITLTTVVSNLRYSQLITEMVQLRVISAEVASAKSGFRSVSLNSPRVGEVEFVGHSMMKQGEALILPMEEVIRSGSSDVAFGVPGSKGGDVFFHLENTNAVEARTFSDEFVMNRKPNQSFVITGITSGA